VTGKPAGARPEVSPTAFLNARLDEEEAAVKGPPGWRLEHWSAVRYAEKASGRDWRVDAEPRCIVDSVAKDDAEHIARYDPARVLREIEADRKLIAAYVAARADVPPVDDWYEVADGVKIGLADGLEAAVKIRAERFGDHPDYQPGWKP
jgi:hypothetical protein